MIAKIGGYEFTHIINRKKGAVVHLLVKDGIVKKVYRETGRIASIEGKTLAVANEFVKKQLFIKTGIEQMKEL